MSHPFDRYAAFTDLAVLNAFSGRPLRKCIRVNTLKTTVADFQKWAGEKQWKLQPVPWCEEGFFIDRADRGEALGKDLLHLVGHFYMQEAASMLPVALLDPQPGETVLDMSAAPGSKTTQAAAMMQSGGVIIANDVQENRLWTLKNAIYRLGVTNVIVTKKVGQWFSKHMTERFDRVLCDAPCTAQGTARKDSDALNYCSMDNIEKMARLQVALLASAINAAKVGGRIVYSTCTLTPEENEGVILEVLKMFGGKVEVVDPTTSNQWSVVSGQHDLFQKVIEDSKIVQKYLTTSHSPLPTLRLWPQTYDTEGFFSAVLTKTASTRDATPMQWVPFQERFLRRKEMEEVGSQLTQHYGSSFLHAGDQLFERNEALLLSTKETADFGLPMQNYSIGMPFGKRLGGGRIVVENECITLRGGEATKQYYDVDETQCSALLDAQDIDCPPGLAGHVILRFHGIPLGRGLAKNGRLKNNLPRWMVRFG